MSSGSVVRLVVLVLLMVFCIYCYNLRTSYNIDKMEMLNGGYERDIEILIYALSLVPNDIKNEVYVKSIKSKYPSVEENRELLILIGAKVPDANSTETFKVPTSPSNAMNRVLDDMKN